MSGSDLLLDSNIILYHLRGEETVERLLDDKRLFISFITEIELKSFKKVSAEELSWINKFISFTTIVHSNTPITKTAIQLKQEFDVKIPDAIIISTAIYLGLPLITADKSMLKVKASGLEMIGYNPI